jgi:phosphopantothenoylcysteine decarboxylase/phosphopantothenate--cysteine ligase
MGALGVSQDLKGETVLVTAGPTYEPIDPVRFIGNRSSGKMGYALAEMAIRRGAKVVLVSGPTALKPPAVDEFVPAETAAQMRKAVLERFPDATVVIKTAAVADFKPKQAAEQKIKRENGISLELEPTEDILAELGANRFPKHIVVGFAAETENLLENARKKLAKKNVDAVVLNDVSRTDIGFGSDRNAVTIVTAGDVVEVGETSKLEVAGRVLDVVVGIRQKKSSQAEKRPETAKL